MPPVSAGGDQDRVMQSLKALATFGADGGPGYAARTQFYEVTFSVYFIQHQKMGIDYDHLMFALGNEAQESPRQQSNFSGYS